MIKRSRGLRSERGSALLATLLVSMMFLALGYTFTQTYVAKSQETVMRIAHQKALDLAETGLSVARQRLKSPDLAEFLDPPGTARTLTAHAQEAGGKYEATLTASAADPSFVDIESIGYYYTPRGGYNDGGQRAQRAKIKASLRVSNISQYVLAKPGDLSIESNVNFDKGKIYAKSLTYMPGSVGVTLYKVYYHLALTPEDWSSLPITWAHDPPDFQLPVQLPSPPTFPMLDGEVRKFYEDRKATLPYPDFSEIRGPGDTPFYFVPGDVDIGQGGPLTVNGVYMIYATGDVRIHNSILLNNPAPNSTDWIAILAEGDIILDGAPNMLHLYGTYLTNRNVKADGVFRNAGSELRLTGGIVCLVNFVQVSNTWASRVYEYRSPPDESLLLPNFSNLLQYEQVTGKE